jgi:hypothetical protein
VDPGHHVSSYHRAMQYCLTSFGQGLEPRAIDGEHNSCAACFGLDGRETARCGTTAGAVSSFQDVDSPSSIARSSGENERGEEGEG